MAIRLDFNLASFNKLCIKINININKNKNEKSKSTITFFQIKNNKKEQFFHTKELYDEKLLKKYDSCKVIKKIFRLLIKSYKV